MKILICSNAPWAKTGYGTQAASLALRMKAAGHDVSFYCNYGLDAGRLEWQGIPCLPNGPEGGYVDPIVHGHIRTFQPDLVLTLFDVWVLKDKPFPLPITTNYPIPRWAAWVPVDHDPLSQANKDVLPRIDYPIAMSRHGHEQLTAAGFKNTYIPHAIEKDIGYTSSGRQEHRRIHQLPEDAFLFGSVGLNRNYPGRKGLDRLIHAFSMIEDERAYLYLHTLTVSQVGSIDLRRIVEFYGVQDRVKFPDEYSYVSGLGTMALNAVYSSIDCYVQPTMGEGFGIPVIEAQACGCPVIATNCTSMPELCGPNNSELIAAEPFMVPDIAHRYLVNVEEMAAKMREVMAIYYDDQVGYKCMKASAGQWANNWDWDSVWKNEWVPFLAEVESELPTGPSRKWHRGQAVVEERDDVVRKRDSTLRSPAVAKELAFIKAHPHPNIIPILADGEEEGLSWFEMPRLTPLRDIDPESLTEESREAILTGVKAAVEYLHSNGVAHRDIAPENIVVDGEHPYLIDFEWAYACMGDKCVDVEPWDVMELAVPLVQVGGGSRGIHTISNYLRGLPLDEKTHGLMGVPYQQVDGAGERDCQVRWDIMQPDVKGKTVIDLGSNMGWFCRKAIEEGAEKAIGVENDRAVVETAQKFTNGHNIEYIESDLAEWGPEGRYGVGLALSVLQHLPDPDSVLDRLVASCEEVYVEIPRRFITERMAKHFQNAEMLGESERGRPIYRVREVAHG